MIRILLLALCMLMIIACTSAESTVINKHTESTVTSDITDAIEVCDKIKALYHTGLNDQNKPEREMYFNKGPITLSQDDNSLLKPNFDPNLSKPAPGDYTILSRLYKHSDRVRYYQENYPDIIPPDITEKQYLALKELEWDRYYIKRCENIEQAFG